jgi:thymidylate synthase
MMATDLGVQLGAYHHFAGSLHIYKKHLALAERIVEAPCPASFSMPQMPSLDGLPELLAIEQSIRTSGCDTPFAHVDDYWHYLAEVLRAFRVSLDQGWATALASVPFRNPYVRVLQALTRGSRAKSVQQAD